MKKIIIQCLTVLLAFLAGVLFMNYVTYMGNRDMTSVMAGATLPVVYVERDGRMYDEMHGYVRKMDGSYMKDVIIGLSEDHELSLAVRKYNAQIESVSYEVRSADMGRLVENGENLPWEDDGAYLHLAMDFRDLLDRYEKYLLILTVDTKEHGEVFYYSQICYLGENHVQECVDFAGEFHRITIDKDMDHPYLSKLETDSRIMDGSSLGYVNIYSNTGPVTWGDAPMEQETEPQITFTGLEADNVSLVMRYRLKNTDTNELYEVSEAFQVRYTEQRMYLNAYERRADRIFTVERQLVKDGQISFGIQDQEPYYRKNEEENVIGFVQQGQLWCYDFGQNRLSLVYGFQEGEDARGLYGAHDFRILKVEDSGSMNFIIYGYMSRGTYEGMCGILLCRYDALLNSVDELYFLPDDRPFQMVSEDMGELAAMNESEKSWLMYRGMVLEIDLKDYSVKTVAENIGRKQIRMSDDGELAAWTDADGRTISLLNTKNGIINRIEAEDGETLRTLGFMEDDFIYGTAREADIRTDAAGRQTVPMYRIIIRDHAGQEVREFEYASKGKYVTAVEIEENRLNLSCVAVTADGAYEEALPEPITYTSEQRGEKLTMKTARHETKRNEYQLSYEGTTKTGSMKRPQVRLTLFEENRTILPQGKEQGGYAAWLYNGEAKCFDTLAEAVACAYDGMGEVWKDGSRCFWERWNRQNSARLDGFGEPETLEVSQDSVSGCMQLLLRQKQIYSDVQADRESGLAVWEILTRELGEDCCLLPGCSLRMAQYYIGRGAPVMAFTAGQKAVLLVGYDSQNVTYFDPDTRQLEKVKTNTAMFEEAGNLFFSYLP